MHRHRCSHVRYTVNAPAKSLVWGTVDQQSVDVVVRVLEPDSTQLTLIDRPATGPERFRLETRAEGAQQVQVIPFKDGTGAYAITLERIEPVTTNPRRLADQLFSPCVHDDTPGGEVAVFRGGKTIFAKAYGMANLTHGIPFRLDTRTNIGSTSKQFTAFAVMLLVKEGKVDSTPTSAPTSRSRACRPAVAPRRRPRWSARGGGRW